VAENARRVFPYPRLICPTRNNLIGKPHTCRTLRILHLRGFSIAAVLVRDACEVRHDCWMMDPRSWLGLGTGLGILIGFLIATLVFGVLKWVQGGLQVQVNRAREELGTKSRRISDLETAQSSDTQRISGLETEIRMKDMEIVGLSAQASRVRALEQEKDILELQVQQQRAELVQLPGLRETESEVNRLRPLTAEVARLRNALHTKDATITQLQEDHARMRERVTRLASQLDFTKQELVDKEEELERLRPPEQ
jgi:hypothetical protein